MNVILLKDVKGLGKVGQVAKVSDGYARNLLIPKGMAKEATESNMKELDRQKATLAAKKAEDQSTASMLAKRLEELTVTIQTKGGEGGRLFGSVTAKDVADGLKEQHGIEMDKRKIVLETPIKQAGMHQLEVKLLGEVTATLKIHVVTDK